LILTFMTQRCTQNKKIKMLNEKMIMINRE
jgi:hypothetical protein